MTLPIDLSAEETDVKKTVLNVIEHGSTYNVEKLAPLYSDNMQIIRVLRDGATSVLTKNDVMQFFASRRVAYFKTRRGPTRRSSGIRPEAGEPLNFTLRL